MFLMAILALSAALLASTSPTDLPGNRRDRMEMTSSLSGSSSRPHDQVTSRTRHVSNIQGYKNLLKGKPFHKKSNTYFM
ncbi:hypothetical protein DPMN_179614 [Dreissena polymorpha]|uniref:Uncharacterized protein n=1 Tax=Dreissena polymorpha TaxID=45954 RepID=A0A9D4IJQ6_DREPO|nr:hypothetical protein DPMN_179614 [Dreissena polymorpha]